jgi:hypothetical protein
MVSNPNAEQKSGQPAQPQATQPVKPALATQGATPAQPAPQAAQPAKPALAAQGANPAQPAQPKAAQPVKPADETRKQST